MRRPILATAAFALASLAFAQPAQRLLLPPLRAGHFASEEPSQVAQNVRNHSKFLQQTVEELARFVKTEPGIDEATKKRVDEMVRAAADEKRLIDEDAGKLETLAGAEPAAAREAGERVSKSLVEPKFE
ncbi:MAG: hypothetical protein HY553_00170 [Elusimicrobia bacterium]|nr:hypothetical protein [Elusimicrobiota bacterium]